MGCVQWCVVCVCGACGMLVCVVCMWMTVTVYSTWKDTGYVRMCGAVKSVVSLHCMMGQHLISIFLLHLIPARLQAVSACLSKWGRVWSRDPCLLIHNFHEGRVWPLLPWPFKQTVFTSRHSYKLGWCVYLNEDVCTHYCSSYVIMWYRTHTLTPMNNTYTCKHRHWHVDKSQNSVLISYLYATRNQASCAMNSSKCSRK